MSVHPKAARQNLLVSFHPALITERLTFNAGLFRKIANDQSAMSRVAGGFLGAALAGAGVASAAPDLTDDVELGSSDLLAGGPSVAVLRGAASAGRRRGKGVFRSTCGIGIGGTNLSSLCATGIANGAKKPDAGDGTGGVARA